MENFSKLFGALVKLFFRVLRAFAVRLKKALFANHPKKL
jgi:hypothetical protein